MFVASTVLAAVASVGACDAGTQANQPTKGPPIRITDVNVGPDKPMLPADGRIQIAVDRYLLPASITRQSVFVVTAGGEPADNELVITYDPVSRTISARGLKDVWLTPGQPYKLQFSVPLNDAVNDRGLRAIDRATLAEPREIAFFATEPAGQTSEKAVDFCGDVLPIFTMKCTSGTCHAGGPAGSNKAAAGLVLDSFTGIQATAIRRVANGANTTGRTGNPEERGRVFGLGMPVIDPGEPGNSWLLYKIELAREPAVDSGINTSFVCNKVPNKDEIALPTADPFRFDVKIERASDLELAILNDHVPGREMPYPSSFVTSSVQQALSFDERQRIRLWIAQGAKMTECGGCTAAAFEPDSGATDAGGSEGGADAAADADADAGADAASDANDQ